MHHYLLLKIKLRLPTYALAFTLDITLILNTILSEGAKPHVEGSAAPLAIPVCHDDATPVDTDTNDPQATRPTDALFRYIWY